jgi:hypothetical protein
MRLIALEIPDDAAALAGWLEGHLVSLDLAALVAELEAVHGAPRKPFTLDQVLGSRREAVLTRGLSVLRSDRLQALLLQPRLLLELQEMILMAGGPYWLRRAAVPETPGTETSETLERTWQRLEPSLAGTVAPTIALPTPGMVSTPPRRRWLGASGRWLVSLAMAAAVLVAIVVVQRWPAQPRDGHPQLRVAASPGWGWDRPGALPQDLPRDAYLNHLADAAHEWFNKRPDTPLALARRIAEFRQGCSVLILSPHRPLPSEDRVWLVEKCRAWATKLDTHLVAVEAGQDPLKVRGEADETINRLIAALRERATRTG